MLTLVAYCLTHLAAAITREAPVSIISHERRMILTIIEAVVRNSPILIRIYRRSPNKSQDTHPIINPYNKHTHVRPLHQPCPVEIAVGVR